MSEGAGAAEAAGVAGAAGRPSVRPATPDDARRIAEIRIETWRATYAGIVPQAVLDRMDVDRTTDSVCGLLSSDSQILVVGPPDGGIVGYAFTSPARDADAAGLGEIEALYVHPDAQGRGFGSALVAAASAHLVARGFATHVLWVLTDNRPAREFYEHLGFTPDGASRTLDFDGEPIGEMRYRRALASPSRQAAAAPRRGAAAYHRLVPNPDPGSPAELSAPVRAFLQEPHFASLATIGQSGGPNQAVIWYRLEPDGRILVNSREGRAWPANLKRDPRCTLAVFLGVDPNRWVGLTCHVDEVVDDVGRARDDIVELSHRYDDWSATGEATFRSQPRVSFHLRIVRVHDHLADD